MRTFGNIIWHFPFLGFLQSLAYAIGGVFWCITIMDQRIFQVGNPIMHQAYCVASLNMKNLISPTPLNCARNAFTLALNDSADAFVRRLSK